MSGTLRDLVRRRAERATAARRARREFAGRVWSDLSDDLPDEDLWDPGEDLDDGGLELYEPGSKPRCEEVEYLELVREAVHRMAQGR